MNLQSFVRPFVEVINPSFVGIIQISTGAVTASDGRSYPTYSQSYNVPMQVQALSSRELVHMDALNIQGVFRAVYLNGNIEGVDRLAGKGGDLLIFGGKTWLVESVLETWDEAGWCKVAVVLQAAQPAGGNLDYSNQNNSLWLDVA